jgi:flagellar assembly protein FliH
MSSKLMRGAAIASEPVAWRRVSAWEPAAQESPAGEPDPQPDEKAQVDVEEQVAAAYRKGVEEGQAALRHSLAATVEAMQMTLARSIEQLTGSRARYRREAEQDSVGLALAVARRILHRELTVAPEALLGVVKAALEKMEAHEVHQVRVARSDAPMLRQFLEQMGPPQRIEVIADAGLAAGSAIVESSRGTLDASVETQLAEIERGFADVAPGAL